MDVSYFNNQTYTVSWIFDTDQIELIPVNCIISKHSCEGMDLYSHVRKTCKIMKFDLKWYPNYRSLSMVKYLVLVYTEFILV